MTYIIDKKQGGKKDVITIVLSINASQKLLLSEVNKLVKLIVKVPATNAVNERSCSTLRRFKTHLRPSKAQ